MRIPMNRRSPAPRFGLKGIAGWLPLLCLTCLPGFSLAQEVTGNSTIGPRTSHIFTLRIPPAGETPGDTLPPGGGIFYQFGIFDTGSTVVAINNVSLTGTDGTVYPSTANYLDLCGPGDVDCGPPTGNPPSVPGLSVLDLRLWGLGVINPSTGGAPLDFPEAEVAGILVQPASVTANLIGGPVTNNVIAYIDYTNEVSNSYIYVPGADTTFYQPGAAGIPVPLYELQLQRFGTTTPSVIDGATRGSLYSLVDFSFTNGGNVVATGDLLSLPESSTREARVFFDTGNTTTQITHPMAAALGIDPTATPDATVNIGSAGGNVTTLPCFTLSNAEFTGTGGNYKYVIASPLVCVSDAPAFASPQSNPHDIILGTNFFEQTQILWNGPGDTIGMFQGVALNSPPVADAGDDQTHECTSSLGASVTLDGLGSYDPDGDPLTYSWTGPFGTATGATPTVTLPLGLNDVSLTVDDGSATDTDDVQITVDDTIPPAVDAGNDVTLEATSPAGAAYDVSTQVTASDTCGLVSLAISPAPASYPLGSTVVTVTATDSSGNADSDTMTVTVVDTTPPDISITVTPEILWPPNHNMIPIGVTVIVSDIADPNPIVELVSVTSDEGDTVDTFDPAIDSTEVVGRKGGDIQLVDGQLFLRAERAGNSDGRVYTITYEATDASGNSASATATVVVPHNQ